MKETWKIHAARNLNETASEPERHMAFPAEYVNKEDFDTTEASLDFVEENLEDQKLHREWYDRYIQDPHLFFNKSHEGDLKSLQPEKRALFLIKEAGLHSVRTSEIESHFERHPEDLAVIYEYLKERNFQPDTATAYSLLGVSARYMNQQGLLDNQTAPEQRQMKQFLDICDRREIGPDFFLSGTSEVDMRQRYQPFGNAADGFFKIYSEAARSGGFGDHVIETRNMLTTEYDSLDDESKKDLLNECLRDLQYSLVWDEMDNSEFTPDFVAEMNQKAKMRSAETEWLGHQVAHSMLYRTYQPHSVFQKEQRHFQHEMDTTAWGGGYVEEYPFHRILLRVLDEIRKLPPSQETASLLVEFWDKNRNPIFANAVADALSTHEPAFAAQELLGIIRKNRKENIDNTANAAILYRLELGKIGISERGVTYLERLYDLGEYNNPAFTAERLTALGDIGIFDEKKKLLGFFKLGDIDREESVVRAEVLEITKELLFHLTGEETEEELRKREEILYEFSEHYNEFFGKEWLWETGIRFNNLTFGEQGWFMQYAKQEKWLMSDEKIERDKKFFTVYGENGLRCFRSLEQDMSGDAIVDIGEKIQPDIATSIFERYNAIADAADRVRKYVSEELEFENVPEQTLTRITQNLLRRGRDLLVEFSRETDADPETLLRRLDEARTDVILYKTAFRTLHESGSKEDLAKMMKSEIASFQGIELDEGEREKLLSIYDRNYPESDQYPAKFREKIFDGLRSAFKNPDSRFYLLRREGEIIGFRRFDAREETEDGRPRKYAGSFNVDPAYRDAKIGNVFYQVTLEREGRDSVIEALVDPETPVSSFYLERYGYVVDGVTDIEGKPFLTMRRDLEANGSFSTRDATLDESVSNIIERAKEINERLSSISVHAVDRTKLFDLVREMTSRGWILTRLPYGEGGRDGSTVIAIFENPSLRNGAEKDIEDEVRTEKQPASEVA